MKVCCLLALSLPLLARAEDVTPRVGLVEVYGVHRLNPEKVAASIKATPGSLLPSRLDAEEKISKLSGVVASRIEAICCAGRNTVLYIGIEERNEPHIEFHANPVEDLPLPKEIADKYEALTEAVSASMHANNADEDLTNGYSLMTDPDCRDLQQALIPLVDANLAAVDKVIRQSADPEQRSAAAYVIQYATRSVRTNRTIADALQWAIQDPDETVRKNAMIALKAVMVGSRLHPQQRIHIEPTWFVELMNSVVWSDRRNSSLALIALTDKKNPEALELIRQRALYSVLEMARWRDLEHALPGFILAGRLAGMDDKSIHEAWLSGNRESVLDRAKNPTGKHSSVTGLLRRDPKKPD